MSCDVGNCSLSGVISWSHVFMQMAVNFLLSISIAVLIISLVLLVKTLKEGGAE